MNCNFTAAQEYRAGPFIVTTIHPTRFQHADNVSVGDVFYKDGSNFVTSYKQETVTLLLQSATVLRQTAFSFISKSHFLSLTHVLVASLKAHKNVEQAWDFDKPCSHCGCIFLQAETDLFRVKCCLGGTLQTSTTFPKLLPLPPHLEFLAVQKINHMTNSSTYYNGALQLGRTYHYLPKTGGAGGLQYFTFDASQTQVSQHENSIANPTSRRQANLQAHFLRQLYSELLQCNYFVQDCELVGSTIGDLAAPASYEADIELVASINIKTNVFDIAAITSDTTTGERILTYKLKECAAACCIPSTSAYLEPLSYPLLFPYGEDGWCTDISKEVKFSTYLCCRMLCPERRDSGEALASVNKDDSRLLPVNRFQLMARLGQLYLVDMTSRVIDFRLHFQKNNANHFHGGQQWQG
ncbi:hypothetical protein B484DRAFT_484083, partial [Ochromonadaceae sp. CCMP2298]